MKPWMVGGLLILIALCVVLSGQAKKQEVNSLTTCESYANALYKAWKTPEFQQVSLFPETVSEDKFEGKVGSQFVSTVLSGNGLVKSTNGQTQDIQYTCLLENDRKAVFFHAMEPKAITSLERCSIGVKTIGESIPCLRETLEREEARLAELQAKTTVQTKKVDQQWPDVKAGQAFVLSTADWKQYRDQECERRDKYRTGGNHPDITLFECQIQKTRQRIQDLEFNG